MMRAKSFLMIGLLVLAVFVLLSPASALKLKPGEYKGDLHMHTICVDGKNTYEEMVQQALKLDFDFIAVSDHWICPEVASLCQNEKRLLCIPGQEYTTQNEGHMLALNITKPLNYNECYMHDIWCSVGPVMGRAIELAHQQNAFLIAAHPTVSQFRMSEEHLQLFDAMECDNQGYSKKASEEAKALSEKYSKPCVYDSDAHNTAALGETYNICKLDKLDTGSIFEAIKAGNCREYMPLSTKIARYFSPAYWIIIPLKQENKPTTNS